MSGKITVKGMGKVSAKPDYVVLSMKLEAKHKEYDKAMDMAAEQLTQLNDSLISVDFKKDAIRTTNFKVSTDYESYKDNQENYQRVFSGFVCKHQLKLSFDFDLKRLSKALNAAAGCPAHPELNITFTVKDADAVNEKLLREATVNAKRKAELLCEASGVKLGRLLTIDYNWGEVNICSNTRYDLAENRLYDEKPRGVKAIAIEPDDIDVSDTATFVWELEQTEREKAVGNCVPHPV